jgi:hypothetical protein
MLRETGLKVERQVPIPIEFHHQVWDTCSISVKP